jgi:hypothetical protein
VTESLVTIVIPMLPAKELSPNWHGSWRGKAREVAICREQCGWAARFSAFFDLLVHDVRPVTLDVHISWSGRRKRLDDDNAKACLKCCIDGISDVLWGGEDSHVSIGRVTQETGGNGEVVVVLSRDAS